MEEDITAIGVNNAIITHKDVDEDIVYELTKGFFENVQEIRDTHNAAVEISIENAINNLPTPLHPGAERYYKEQGLIE